MRVRVRVRMRVRVRVRIRNCIDPSLRGRRFFTAKALSNKMQLKINEALVACCGGVVGDRAGSDSSGGGVGTVVVAAVDIKDAYTKSPLTHAAPPIPRRGQSAKSPARLRSAAESTTQAGVTVSLYVICDM